MVRNIAVALLVLAWFTVSASAQFVVIDPGNLAQAVLIAQRAQQAYEQLRLSSQEIHQRPPRSDPLPGGERIAFGPT